MGWWRGRERGCRSWRDLAGIPCRGSQANTHGAGAVEGGEPSGMTQRSTRVGRRVFGIGLRARSGFGRYTELSKGKGRRPKKPESDMPYVTSPTPENLSVVEEVLANGNVLVREVGSLDVVIFE